MTFIKKLICRLRGHAEHPLVFSYHMKKGSAWIPHVKEVEPACRRCKYNFDIKKYQTLTSEGMYADLTLEWK